MKILGKVLLGLGAFLIMLGVMGLVWAPGVIKKTPIDVDSVTYLEGEASKLGSPVAPVVALSKSQVDSDASSDGTAVFYNESCAYFGTDASAGCLEFDDPDTIALSDDYFATDRDSAESVESDELPADAVPHEGLVNKWPFDVEQKTYPYWDGVLGEAVDAEFNRTEVIEGLETYVFQVNIDEAPIDVLEGVPGTYTDAKEIFVDPRTGAIIHQTDDQQRVLDDGTVAIDLQLAFTEEQQQTNVADAEDNIASIDLLTRTVPIVGFVGGTILIAAGAFLLWRRRETATDERPVHRETVGAGH